MKNDKCDICALKVIFDQDSLSKERKIEDFFGTLRYLQENKIIDKGYNRRIFASIGTDGSGDKSEMCAVNSKFFISENKDKKCPEFILNMDLSVPDALSLNLSKKTVKLTYDMKLLTWVLVVFTVALFVISIFPVQKLFQQSPIPIQQSIITELKPNKETKQTQTEDRTNKMSQKPNPSGPIQTVPQGQKKTNGIHK